ncbi:hypothetical protein Fmac_021807 [Flemingia macrophylla]|uniref:Uncharacterized protein n=1 Tax=Flemingia macrophylla TaxID=520843 RepID=A0ABD1LXX7_9FABA
MPQVIVRPRRRRVGEVAGGAAADCTAVACCCPCAVLNILALAVYKLPKGLVLRARRRRFTKNKTADAALLQPHRCGSDLMVGSTRLQEFFIKGEKVVVVHDDDLDTLEKEMWARFADTGFWRSESQRRQ